MIEFNFAKSLLAWHKNHGRHDLPWQQPRSAYRVWVSEIMLQQTQVSTVINYFTAFMLKFPTLSDLALAPSEQVMQLWAGLGYYSRARNLHKSAQICLTQFAGELPYSFAELLALPGIGRSTAGAILSQAHGLPFAILDGNVKRVLTRFHAISGDTNTSAVQSQLWQFAESHLPQTKLADYTQALMDLGATLCTRSNPDCMRCPLATHCQALQSNCVANYPSKKVRKTVPKRETCALIMISENNEILLEQRPNHGIWGGLFSLPEASNSEQALAFVKQFIKRPKTADTLNPFTHQFSHFQLTIKPSVWHNCARKTQIRDNNQYQWIAREQLSKIGLPAPIKKLLQDLK
jgi:A/G-specific adenine glycosylase